MRSIWKVMILALLLLTVAGCFRSIPPTATHTYNLTELKYRLFAEFDVFWVNPYLWPLVREEQEQLDALAEYPSIRANNQEFVAIADYLALSIKEKYTDEEKLLIYRQHNKLALAVQMTPAGSGFDFELRAEEGQGWRYEGRIGLNGVIVVNKAEPSFNTYPICLASGTSIATPDGPTSVESLQPGMTVYSQDSTGNRMVVAILNTSKTPVPPDFQILTLNLEDGRTLTASPGHPTGSCKPLGSYRVGDWLDGSAVASVRLHPYSEIFTYDILPDSESGRYWADGILLGSTLAERTD